MKLIYAMLSAALLLVPACNRSDTDRVRAAPADRVAATDVQKDQRDEYVKSIDAKLAEFDQKFDGLDARTKALTGAAKRDLDDAIRRLRDQRQIVSKKLDDLKSVSVESWSTLKGEVDAGVADLERSYEQVSATHETTPATPRTRRQ